ncbi:MAG TPA: FISUMP domain-containing protein [Bacteroidales bacterium]|nr:FISUMP domain-containing protein [Bacteroidales bacterium]
MKKKIYLSSLLLFVILMPFSGMAQTESVLWSENFEGDWTQNWYVDNGTWEVGTPTSGPNAAYGGTKCAATILAGNYGANVSSRLIRFTSFVVPAAADNPRLRFYNWFSLGSGDFSSAVQIREVGTPTWTSIGYTIRYSSSGVWSSPYIDLKPYAGQNVQIAFYFASDNNTTTVGPGWYIDDVSLVTGTAIFNNPETFENGIGDWGVTRGTWEIGDPTGSAHGGQNCAATNLTGNYSNYVESMLVSPPFLLPSVNESPRLRFWHFYSFDSGDFGVVLVKPTQSKYWVGLSDQIINNSGGIWTYTLYDLSVFAGEEIQFAFYFFSDANSTTVSTGWYIDDLVIESTPYSDQITLNSGWNLISFDVNTNQAAPANLFQPLISSNNLQMVTGFQNQTGVFFDPNGPPFLNTLQHMNDGEGYWTKLQNAANLAVNGTPLSKSFSVDLLAGWNLIGHWSWENAAPENAFASLINAGILEMVTSYEQGGLFFDPNGAPFLNTLTELKNGFGYWVKLSENYNNFSYPESSWACGNVLYDGCDGQEYATVQIGDQCWMAENLNVGVRINRPNSSTDNDVIEKYCYDNNPSNCDIYGGLYRWNEMMGYKTTPGIQGICPDGWHLPTDAEWSTLTTYVSSQPEHLCNSNTNYIAKALAANIIWNTHTGTCTVGNNISANNSTNLSSLPGGCIQDIGYSYLGYDGYWWSSTEYSTTYAWAWYIHYDKPSVNHYDDRKEVNAYSVRCVKD